MGRRQQSSAFFIGVLAGAILGALGRGVLQAFVGLPLVLPGLASLCVAIALIRCRGFALTSGALGTGIALSVLLPSALAPPGNAVMTKAPPLIRGVDIFDALAKLDANPASLEGKQITVSGLWRPLDSSGPAAVYRVVMACCAADAVEAGFDVRPARTVDIAANAAVTVTGVPAMVMRSGETRFELRDARVVARAKSFAR